MHERQASSKALTKLSKYNMIKLKKKSLIGLRQSNMGLNIATSSTNESQELVNGF